MRMSNEQLITPGGLATVGQLINKTALYNKIDTVKTKTRPQPRISNSDVVGTYIGLLCQGKSDFEATNELKEETELYSGILGIKTIPSAETLRQRINQISPQALPVIKRSNVELLRNTHIRFTPCLGEHVPVDIDVSPFDNSNTQKEGVSWTYKKVMGYAPIFAYLGMEGYQLNVEFREGSQHCQKNTVPFLTETLKFAKKVTAQPLLVRLDSGNDSADNMAVCYAQETDFIIKRNLRQEEPMAWLSIGMNDKNATVTEPREGKTIYIGSAHHHYIQSLNRFVRIVYEVIERTSAANGQMLIVPEIEANTWWVSFPENGEGAVSNEDIIKTYHDHGTCEQFHSEIKTDMDLERLPSGHFNTNAAVLTIAMFAYNILRIIGQTSLMKDDSPLKRPVKRRRIKTVIQNLITLAVHVVRHARKTIFNLGNSNAWRFTFQRVYESLAL